MKMDKVEEVFGTIVNSRYIMIGKSDPLSLRPRYR